MFILLREVPDKITVNRDRGIIMDAPLTVRSENFILILCRSLRRLD